MLKKLYNTFLSTGMIIVRLVFLLCFICFSAEKNVTNYSPDTEYVMWAYKLPVVTSA